MGKAAARLELELLLPPDPSVRRVLIYRLGSLGDTVVTLPCFHLIARVFPEARRVLLTNFPVHAKAPAAAAVLGDSGLVHEYMSYSAGTRNPLELVQLAWRIRRFRPDILIYLPPVRPLKDARRDRRFFRLVCAIPRLIGLPEDANLNKSLDRATVQNLIPCNPATGLNESEASRLARSIASLGDAAIDRLENWSLRLTATERATADAALGPVIGHPLIVCGPGTKMQSKDWGQEKWRKLLESLRSSYPRHGLALVGAREDHAVSEYVASGWHGPKVNLSGLMSPRETAAVLEHADVFVGPDSGPMHLAASVGVPCVIAFSARGFRGVWFPAGDRHQVIYHAVSCQGCGLETCLVERRRCLTSITVEEMADAVKRVLDAP
jgi:ADP-heptose:LPS heptosyltransferase